MMTIDRASDGLVGRRSFAPCSRLSYAREMSDIPLEMRNVEELRVGSSNKHATTGHQFAQESCSTRKRDQSAGCRAAEG